MNSVIDSMIHTQQDIDYYKFRVILICSKKPPGVLPGKRNLFSFLQNFGIMHDLQTFYVREEVEYTGPPNTAIVIFKSRSPIPQLLDSSRNETKGSFWNIHSLTTRLLPCSSKPTDIISRHFTEMVERLVRLRSNVQPSGSNNPSLSSLSHSSTEQSLVPAVASLDSREIGPPAKRFKTEDAWNRYIATDIVAPVSGPSSRAHNDAPASPEWMIRRIAQLQTELENVRAAHDMAISEQDVIQTARRAEQNVRREIMAQKSAVEALLSRGQIEQKRLCTELETALAQRTALSDEVDDLRGQLTTKERTLKQARSSLKSSKRINDLETELGEATIKLDDAKTKIGQLKSTAKQLKSDLRSTQKQLESTQESLESTQNSLESRILKYKSTKPELSACKTELKSEQKVISKLKDTLTPEAYKSLGQTHKILGVCLSTMGFSPVGEGEGVVLEDLE
ncbi:unnamed protein product [Rhizoctonia solani]|uniref:Uncharacterized protein n=1 Tax=Rhizoctonia solani TaxID=456999 RepID=A0A8H3DTL2_9AGAM|nr:unnamed protein product [Rhizoctonia solani]